MWHPNLIDCEGNGELRRIITSLADSCTRTLTGKDGVRCDRRTNKLIHIWGIGQSTIPMKSKDKLTKRENYSNVLEVIKLDKPEDWASEFDKLPVMRASTVWLWHKWKNKVIRSGRQEKKRISRWIPSQLSCVRLLLHRPSHRPPVDSSGKSIRRFNRPRISFFECLFHLASKFNQVWWETSYRAIKTVNTCSDDSHA